MLKSYKMSRGEMDQRVRAPCNFSDLVEQEDAKRAKPRRRPQP
jgi:hypothetical protein